MINTGTTIKLQATAVHKFALMLTVKIPESLQMPQSPSSMFSRCKKCKQVLGEIRELIEQNRTGSVFYTSVVYPHPVSFVQHSSKRLRDT